MNIRLVLGSTRRYQEVSYVFLQNVCQMCVIFMFMELLEEIHKELNLHLCLNLQYLRSRDNKYQTMF